MFRPLMAQPCMGLAERFRILARISLLVPTWVALQVVTSWNSMLELIWVVLLGPPETNRRKPFCFYGRLPVAQLICCELYL